MCYAFPASAEKYVILLSVFPSRSLFAASCGDGPQPVIFFRCARQTFGDMALGSRDFFGRYLLTCAYPCNQLSRESNALYIGF